LSLLRFLAKRGVRNFIVSFGEPKTQHAKVKALGLGASRQSKRSISPIATMC